MQCLQRLHGGRDPWVRHGGTMLALFRLRDKGLLSGAEYARLANAYQFLRHLEHRLQFDEDLQTHTLPADPDALDLLARKMPPGRRATPTGKPCNANWTTTWRPCGRSTSASSTRRSPCTTPSPPSLRRPGTKPRARARRATSSAFSISARPRLAAAVAAAGLRRGRERFEHFLEKAFAIPAILDRLDAGPNSPRGLLDLFEHSPYFADELLRYPGFAR